MVFGKWKEYSKLNEIKVVIFEFLVWFPFIWTPAWHIFDEFQIWPPEGGSCVNFWGGIQPGA